MRTVAETSIFIRYASEIWTDAERMEFINWIAAHPDAGDVIPGSGGCERKFQMPSEKKQFQEDLLESVRQMRSGQPSRITTVNANISLSLPVDVIERWQASGPDWQLRMAKLLAETQP